MADDRTTPPAPRPRRRRTDIDPNAQTPTVANDRRRNQSLWDGPAEVVPVASAGPEADIETAPDAPRAFAVPAPLRTDAPADATAPFHVPGLAATAVASPPSLSDEGPATRLDPGRAWLSQLDERSFDPNTCPFLRAAADGALFTPIERPDPANRCAALAEAVPQSLRQQELVCLSSGHINCPRYLRGAAVVVETPAPVVRRGRSLTTPVFASLVLFVMAVSASVAFAFARGGIGLMATGPSASATAVAAVPSSSIAAPVATPSAEVTQAASSAPITPSPSPIDTPSLSATSSQQPTATSAPKSDRYKLLKACPNTPKCWIYRVRSGDNLYSIANYFGVSLKTVQAWNPWTQDGLKVGRALRIPTPTR